ncbi:hypothetical protein EAG_15986 [Camponotus floridanus]|uniref:Uncharacterized protein n=1 Tax=Camponotus floridanus TaxID=104421 RepID=E2A342_CAMFO|nr:hypothetical protein EAG_15986 [Camponotus floridanus]
MENHYPMDSPLRWLSQRAFNERVSTELPAQEVVYHHKIFRSSERKLRGFLRFSSAIGIHDDAMIVSSSPRHQRVCRVLVTEIEASSVKERWSNELSNAKIMSTDIRRSSPSIFAQVCIQDTSRAGDNWLTMRRISFAGDWI